MTKDEIIQAVLARVECEVDCLGEELGVRLHARRTGDAVEVRLDNATIGRLACPAPQRRASATALRIAAELRRKAAEEDALFKRSGTLVGGGESPTASFLRSLALWAEQEG